MKSLIVLLFVMLQTNCSKSNSDEPVVNPPITNPQTGVSDVDFWLTQGNQSVKLAKQNTFLKFGNTSNNSQTITVEESQTFQTIDGFGYSLTGGSAQLINQLNASKKAEFLQELFGSNANSVGISYLRISIGASDLNVAPFTYNDGAVDPTLANFSLSQDAGAISLLKEILLINPNIKILGSPWSPPVWMKDNGSSVGGGLQLQYYNVYSSYFVKYMTSLFLSLCQNSLICPKMLTIRLIRNMINVHALKLFSRSFKIDTTNILSQLMLCDNIACDMWVI